MSTTVQAPQNEQKGLILLAYYFLPDNTSGVQRAVRFFKYLPRNGFSTYAICSSRKGGQSEGEDIVYTPNEATQHSGAARAARIAALVQRFFLPYNEQLPWVPHAVVAARQLLACRPISAIVSTSPPLATHLAALWLKKRHRIRWVADFRDPLLGNPGRPRRWARLYDIALERLIFRSADCIIAVTDAVADEWRRRYPQWAGKIHVIWNGFDPEEAIRPLPLPARKHKVLLHAGVLYVARHPLPIAESLHRLISNGCLSPDSVRLRLVGLIEQKEVFLRNSAVSALVENGCLEADGTLVPRTEAIREIATADFLLLLDIVNLSETGYTVPAKLYDYILIGRPVLAVTDPDSPVDRILSRSGIPHTCIYHGDPGNEIDRKLLAFFHLPTEAVSPSPWFLEHFDGERQAAALARILGGRADS